MKSLVIDPRMSGITGEMLMSALLDLTQDQECLPLLSKAICEVTHCTASVKAVKTDSNGIRAIKLDKEFNGEKFASPDDLERAFKNIANFMEISPIALEKGLDIIRTIGKSRKKVLAGTSSETGDIETAIEVAGVLWLLERHEYLGGNITSLPVAIGNNPGDEAKGNVPSPDPVSLEIICQKSIPVTGAYTGSELSSADGLALLGCLADNFTNIFPTSTPVNTGHGTDKNQNMTVRVIETIASNENGTHAILLESLVDDATGETMGHALNVLLEAGAYDAFISPATGKKNRPAVIVSVLCAPGEEKAMSLLMMQCTGSIGVRYRAVDRFVADRKMEKYKVEIGGQKHPVRIKISTFEGRLISRKPEFDDLAAISGITGLSPRVISEEVKRQCFLPIKDSHN